MKQGFPNALLVLLGTAAFFLPPSLPVVFAQEGKKTEIIALKDGMANVESTLKAEDEKDPVQKFPCKVFAVDFKGGQNYQIDMMSKDLDSYLRLEDGAGKELARDDDSGGNLNARIMFNCPKDGAYRLICTTFGGGIGSFTLTIQQSGLAKAAELTLKDGLAQVEAQLTATDAKDAVQTNSFCKIYAVKLAKGKVYQIDMMSKNLDSYLRLEDGAGKELAKDDDSGGNLNARIMFKCPADGAYRLICTTFGGGGTGPFTLTIKQAEAAKAAELILKDGLAQVEAQLTATDAKDAKQTNSFCKIYAVKLAKGKAYLIDMMSKDVDSFLRLENSAGKELAKDDDSGGGHDARIQFTCPEDGEYRIVATTFFSGTGAFTLTVKEN